MVRRLRVDRRVMFWRRLCNVMLLRCVYARGMLHWLYLLYDLILQPRKFYPIRPANKGRSQPRSVRNLNGSLISRLRNME